MTDTSQPPDRTTGVGQTERNKEDQAFVCQQCGQCCSGEGGIVISNQDLKRLAQGLGLNEQECATQFLTQSGRQRVLKTSGKGQCIFFDQDQGCLVHSYKPDICRAWPFFRGNLIDKQSWLLAQEYCPGINPHLDHKQFVNQGLDYIHEHGLIKKDPDQANSLVNEHELKRLKDAI